MRELRIDQQSEYIEKVITINRVTKVTKGGKKFSFTALVVVGDSKGKVGFALGKAHEVAEAIRKGLVRAKREMVAVPREGFTIPHEIIGKYGAAKVLLMPASEGTGVIASGPVRAICEAAGIKDILTKSLNYNNPLNVIKATLWALSNLKVIENEKKDISRQENTEHAA
jgi:small subunit ribosomal protein S5